VGSESVFVNFCVWSTIIYNYILKMASVQERVEGLLSTSWRDVAQAQGENFT
jgi:hypothetical protein